MTQSTKLISGVIITFNEERNIEDCILSMRDVVDEIIVVDSYSTDATPSICKKLDVKFLQHNFEGHIQQKNFAMEQATHDIVLSLDADERVSDEMKQSIKITKETWPVDAYEFNRYNNYCGSWLKYAWYPDRKLRLWDRRKGKWGGTNPHDQVIMETNDTQRLAGDILHYAYANQQEHIDQIHKFARIAAEEKFKRDKRVILLWHLILNPAYRFISTMFIKGGLFDGYYGFVYSRNAAYLNFLKYQYLWKLNKQTKSA